MKTPKMIVAALGLGGVSALGWWSLSPSKEAPVVPEASPIQVNHFKAISTEDPVISPGVAQVTPAASQQFKGEEKRPQESESQPVQLTRQLAVLSDVYAAEIRYPPYSKPITANSVSYLKPNRFTAVDMSVLGDTGKAALSLPKYRFFDPEEVTLSLKTDLAVSAIRYEFYDLNSHQRFLVKHTDRKTLTVAGKANWPQEIRVKAIVDFDRGTDVVTADFRYQVPVAYVNSAAAPTAQGADMLIPLNLDVTEAGIYRIRANLYQQGGEVIAALSSKSRLGEGLQSLVLKVHQSVLSGTDGHYQLKNWVVERMSGMPGEKASFGVSRQPVMTLAPFQVSSLSQEAYKPNAQEQQRLDFLRQAAAP